MTQNLRARVARLETGKDANGRFALTPPWILVKVADSRPGPVYAVDVGRGWVKKPQHEDEDAFIKRIADEEYRRLGPAALPGSAQVVYMHLSNRSDPPPRLEQSYLVIGLDDQDESIEEEQNAKGVRRPRGARST